MDKEKIKTKAKEAMSQIVKAARVLIEAEDEYFGVKDNQTSEKRVNNDKE